MLTKAKADKKQQDCLQEHSALFYEVASYADKATEEFETFIDKGTTSDVKNNLFNVQVYWQELYNLETPECMTTYKNLILNQIQIYAQLYFFLDYHITANVNVYEVFVNKAMQDIFDIRGEIEAFWQ